jgi:NADH-quinone oxidoreductase subunit J
LEGLSFWLGGTLTVTAGMLAVTRRNAVASVMWLVAAFLGMAVLFFGMDAAFIGVIQILVYAGAILVLFLFVIMLLNVQRERAAHSRSSGLTWGAAVCAAVLAGAVMRLLWAAHSETIPPPLDTEAFSLRAVARELFSVYLLPFEIIGLLLLVAVVAASWVARKPLPGEPGDAPDSPVEAGK